MTDDSQTKQIKTIITHGDAALLVRQAKTLGEKLARHLKTSQLRNVYGAIRRAANLWEIDQQKAYNEIILLQPKLAYFTRRERAMAPLKDALNIAIDVLNQDISPNKAHFENFVNFSEAIVAYHSANRRQKD